MFMRVTVALASACTIFAVGSAFALKSNSAVAIPKANAVTVVQDAGNGTQGDRRTCSAAGAMADVAMGISTKREELLQPGRNDVARTAWARCFNQWAYSHLNATDKSVELVRADPAM